MFRGNNLEAMKEREVVLMWMCARCRRRIGVEAFAWEWRRDGFEISVGGDPNDCGVTERSSLYRRRLKWESLFPMGVLENNRNAQGSSTKWREESEGREGARLRGKAEGCSWGGVPGLQRIAWREWLAPVFQPLRVFCAVSPRTHGRGRGGRAAGPFGLHMEPEKILNFCCCSGTNLCKEARMTPGHNVFPAPVQVHVTA